MIASPETLEPEPQTPLPIVTAVTQPGRDTKPEHAVAHDASGQTLYLIGRPTLKSFLRFIAREATDPEDDASLIAEWQAAKDHVRELEKSEAGHADKPLITSIEVDGKYKPLLVEFLKDPLVQNGFNTVPTEVAFIDLD